MRSIPLVAGPLTRPDEETGPRTYRRSFSKPRYWSVITMLYESMYIPLSAPHSARIQCQQYIRYLPPSAAQAMRTVDNSFAMNQICRSTSIWPMICCINVRDISHSRIAHYPLSNWHVYTCTSEHKFDRIAVTARRVLVRQSHWRH